ncbi:MAG: PIN domain-containing protein [Deltaproteobacteria bacterium]|nr:PIN domain-containing protein [Deltaproteobacteria bacterium]
MKDKYFLDTNIIVYSFDPNISDKQCVARRLIHSALTGSGCISYQVVQEFMNVATRKFKTPLSIQDCKIYLNDVLAPLCEIFPGIEFFSYALQIRERWQFSFYDSLIVAAALQANCTILYTEDLQHGQLINGLTITNPFF